MSFLSCLKLFWSNLEDLSRQHNYTGTTKCWKHTTENTEDIRTVTGGWISAIQCSVCKTATFNHQSLYTHTTQENTSASLSCISGNYIASVVHIFCIVKILATAVDIYKVIYTYTSKIKSLKMGVCYDICIVSVLIKACWSYLTSHCGHGNCRAFQGGIFSFPLWGYSLDLCVELDALERENKNIKLWRLFLYLLRHDALVYLIPAFHRSSCLLWRILSTQWRRTSAVEQGWEHWLQPGENQYFPSHCHKWKLCKTIPQNLKLLGWVRGGWWKMWCILAI